MNSDPLDISEHQSVLDFESRLGLVAHILRIEDSLGVCHLEDESAALFTQRYHFFLDIEFKQNVPKHVSARISVMGIMFSYLVRVHRGSVRIGFRVSKSYHQNRLKIDWGNDLPVPEFEYSVPLDKLKLTGPVMAPVMYPKQVVPSLRAFAFFLNRAIRKLCMVGRLENELMGSVQHQSCWTVRYCFFCDLAIEKNESSITVMDTIYEYNIRYQSKSVLIGFRVSLSYSATGLKIDWGNSIPETTDLEYVVPSITSTVTPLVSQILFPVQSRAQAPSPEPDLL